MKETVPAGGMELHFDNGGCIVGTLGEDLTPEKMVALGRSLGPMGKVALGCFGGPGAQMLLRALASGITAEGGTVLLHNMECAAQAAWLAESYQLPASVFVQQDGRRAYLQRFDGMGLPMGQGREHKAAQELGKRTQWENIGRSEWLSVRLSDYARDGARRVALRRGSARSVRVAVESEGPEQRAVRMVLEELGCQVTDRWRQGIPSFAASRGGLRLTARDESGALLSPGQLLGMVALVELEHGDGRLAVPDEATAAIELIAAGFDKGVQRLGRDGEEARRLYHSLPWLRDAAFAAGRLCARMAMTGERLEQLAAKTPRFVSWQREVALHGDQRLILRELALRTGRELRCGEGLRLNSRGGWVYLVPLSRRSALKVVAEGADPELAAELCDFYAGQAVALDRKFEGEATK